MRLLLIEDDEMIGKSIREGLRRESYGVDWVRDGWAAEQSLIATDYDLLILDLGLPRVHGLQVLKNVRQKGKKVPVLIITARDGVEDRVNGLDAGADDYLVKPFKLIADIRQGVNRVSRLIEQILTLARLDPDYGGQSETIRLHEFTKAIYEELQPQAAAKSIRFTLNAASPASIIGDATSLRALLRNLVDNAIRYTPAQGTVTIELSRSDKSVEIAISDTGPGMTEEMRHKAFARFFRGDNAPETTGTGLGLAIAQRAAERLGAGLSLKNGPNGYGLTAVVVFPKAPETTVGKTPPETSFSSNKAVNFQSNGHF